MENRLYPKIRKKIETLNPASIRQQRKEILAPLIAFIQKKISEKEKIKLNFICTHNSRRSQFSQAWAQVMAEYFHLPLQPFSGGVEVTAFNPTAVATLVKEGFRISGDSSENPHFKVEMGRDISLTMFSKKYDHPENPLSGFAAVMTCSHAHETCPFIPGADLRIPVEYEDPKAFDGTPQEEKKYKKCSDKIATEMSYVFSEVKDRLEKQKQEE